MAKDPVCGMNIVWIKYVSKVNEQKVYFSSDQCKKEFHQNPQKYGY